MAQVAKGTGLGRESLYKALAPGAKPRYDTVLLLFRALGVELHMTLVFCVGQAALRGWGRRTILPSPGARYVRANALPSRTPACAP